MWSPHVSPVALDRSFDDYSNQRSNGLSKTTLQYYQQTEKNRCSESNYYKQTIFKLCFFLKYLSAVWGSRLFQKVGSNFKFSIFPGGYYLCIALSLFGRWMFFSRDCWPLRRLACCFFLVSVWKWKLVFQCSVRL